MATRARWCRTPPTTTASRTAASSSSATTPGDEGVQPWQQFYEMLGGVAATLLGLLFVAVSLNAERILSAAHEHSRRLAEQAFQNYLAVLVVSLFVEMPGYGPSALGFTLLIMSGIWGAWAVVRLGPLIARPFARDTRLAPVRRYLVTLMGFALLVL